MSAFAFHAFGNQGCQTLARHDPARRTYRKLVLKDGRLAGAVLVGDVEQGGVLIALIQRRTPLAIPPERLLEPSFNFATLLP
jgi:nitrite reductase (NADH) large subunit